MSAGVPPPRLAAAIATSAVRATASMEQDTGLQLPFSALSAGLGVAIDAAAEQDMADRCLKLEPSLLVFSKKLEPKPNLLLLPVAASIY